ncbi:MAG: formimidoylglutamase [Pyrinomonadaceae bacterium]|nr:formimidoylglutamase [Phycisphaerales bacterium]
MVPHTTPPCWPDIRPGRFAAAIIRNHQPADAKTRSLPGIAAGCKVALIGLPDDTGVYLNNGRVGARLGPTAFRAALSRYGVADSSLPPVFDAGDIAIGQDIHETHHRITAAVETLLAMGLFPIGIGGGHDLTFPFVRAVARHIGNHAEPMKGIYLDAHLDVRAEIGSGMPFRRLVEDCRVTSLTCIGADPFANSAEHLAWFNSHGGSIQSAPDAERDSFAGREPTCFVTTSPLFVSIDLDCLNVANAPGVSAINPVGLTPQTVAWHAHCAGRSPHVRCFDIMELNPTYDIDNRTARLAAHLFLQFLRGFAERASF